MSEAREKYYMEMNDEFTVVDKITAGNYSDELEQQNKEMLEALIKAIKYMQIQRPFMNYSDDVELYENNIKIIESVTGKDIEEIIT